MLSYLALQPNHDQLRSLFEASLDMICSIDRNGHFVSVSPAARRILGYAPEELVGRAYIDMVLPADQPLTNDAAAAIMSGVVMPRFENRYLHKDGHIVDVQWAAQWDEAKGIMFCVARENPERRLREEIRREAQTYHRQLTDTFEQMTLGFYSLDRDLRVTYWNGGAENLFGVSRNEMLGKKVLDWYSPEASCVYRPVLEGLLASGKPFFSEHICPQVGRWVEASAYAGPEGITVFIKDVHERHLLAEELAQQQQRLHAAVIAAQEKERAEVGRELHDNVNQVLTSVKLYQELGLSGQADPQALMERSARLLQDAINEIRALSKRLSAPSLGPARLSETIGELVEAIASTEQFELDFQARCIDDLEVDEELHLVVYRILQEHLTNVLKYSGARKVRVMLDGCGDQLLLTVSDDGRGFDPRVRRPGIGISNMQTRAASLNGTFDLDSAPGAGCTLAVSFPLAA